MSTSQPHRYRSLRARRTSWSNSSASTSSKRASSGCSYWGYSGWVQDAFYGAGLVAAVTVAHLVRNRTRVA